MYYLKEKRHTITENKDDICNDLRITWICWYDKKITLRLYTYSSLSKGQASFPCNEELLCHSIVAVFGTSLTILNDVVCRCLFNPIPLNTGIVLPPLETAAYLMCKKELYTTTSLTDLQGNCSHLVERGLLSQEPVGLKSLNCKIGQNELK